MKLHLLKIPNLSDCSFSLKQFKQSNINSRWHYHPEIELIRIHKGNGTQFMGDSIKRFYPGDVYLIGSNLPHFFRYDDDKILEVETVFSTVIHFTDNLWGKNFIHFPENILLNNLFETSKRGVLLRGETRDKVIAIMDKIKSADGTFRLVYLLECLAVIAKGNAEDVTVLSSLGFQLESSDVEQERINKIYDYSFKHFKNRIPLETIAAEVDLVPSSFCRYFKSKTGKSFTMFILELRVGNSCKLLQENKLTIKEVCFESGFNNFSSFHKHFKAIKGVSPKKYKKSQSVKPISDL